MVSTSIISPVYEAENIINELVRRAEFEIQKLQMIMKLFLLMMGALIIQGKQLNYYAKKTAK